VLTLALPSSLWLRGFETRYQDLARLGGQLAQQRRPAAVPALQAPGDTDHPFATGEGILHSLKSGLLSVGWLFLGVFSQEKMLVRARDVENRNFILDDGLADRGDFEFDQPAVGAARKPSRPDA